MVECKQVVPEFLEQYRPEGDVLEFDDDSDKEFFDNQSNADSNADANDNADADADADADAESTAAKPEAEESDKVAADDAEDDKPAVPRPTVTSEEGEASAWWGPATTVTERKKPREEAKPRVTKAGLASSNWAPKPKPAPKDDDAFWQ